MKQKKTMKVIAIRNLGAELLMAWNDNKNAIKMKGKPLLDLVGLKKEIEKMVEQIQESFETIAERHGAVRDGMTLSFPENMRAEANKELIEFGETTMDIEYSPIKITPLDEIPVALLDVIFDFVEIED